MSKVSCSDLTFSPQKYTGNFSWQTKVNHFWTAQDWKGTLFQGSRTARLQQHAPIWRNVRSWHFWRGGTKGAVVKRDSESCQDHLRSRSAFQRFVCSGCRVGHNPWPHWLQHPGRKTKHWEGKCPHWVDPKNWVKRQGALCAYFLERSYYCVFSCFSSQVVMMFIIIF